MADVQCPVCQGMMDDECTVCFGRGVISGPESRRSSNGVKDAEYYGHDLEGEIWKPIKSQPRYQISNMGRILNTDTGRLRKVYLNGKGWPCFTIETTTISATFSVNRLVAESFMPGFIPEKQVDFLDGNHTNCALSNLYQTNRSVRGKAGAQA